MGLHLSSFYDSLNSSPGILIESDFSLSYSSPCQPKESDLSLACHFQNRSPAVWCIYIYVGAVEEIVCVMCVGVAARE